MRPLKSLLSFVLILTSSYGYGQSREFRKLCSWMEGTFSSRKQHLKDTADFFDIRLHMTRIWKDRNDGCWFYVEQAVAGSENKPYRQRVYHVMETSNGQFESVIFTLNAPLRFAQKPELLGGLSPDSLQEKSGCSVKLSFDGKAYKGGTDGKECPSDRRGAKYTTSEVTVTKKMLLSWDRGYDDSGKQVWGAEKGGYRFLKQ